MEFTQDIAVFQAAVLLAEKLCKCPLVNYKRHSCPKAIAVVKETIREITKGLSTVSSPSHQHHAKLRITAVLVVMVTSEDEEDEWGYFAGVRSALPPVNWEFFIDVIQSCSLMPYLCQILQNVSKDEVTTVLKNVLSQMTNSIEDGESLANLSHFLFLQNSKHLRSIDAIDSQEFLSQFFNCIKRDLHLGDKYSKEVKSLLFIAVINLICGIISGKASILKYGEKMQGKNSKEENLESFIETFEKMGNKEMEDSFQEYEESSKCMLVTSTDVKDIDYNPEQLLTELLEISNILLKTVSSCDLICLIKPLVCSKETSHIPQLPLKLIQCCIKGGVLTLESASKLEKLSGMRSNIMEVLKLLKQTRERFNTACLDQEKKKPMESKISEAIIMVDSRMQDYEASFNWLLKQDLNTDPRIMECIERNHQLLTSVEFLLQMMDKLEPLAKSGNISLHHQVKQLVFMVYKNLSVELQNHVMYHVHSQFTAESLFMIDSAQFKLDLTMIFNRLISTQGQVDKAQQEISVLALQSPKQVLYKLVTDAIHHSGQIQIYVKLLQRMPTACRVMSSVGTSLLCDAFQTRLKGMPLSRNEEQNALSFIQQLMQATISESPSDACDEVLLNAVEFVTTCVIPHLHYPYHGEPKQDVPLLLAMNFLKVSLETTLKNKCDWLPSLQSLPLLFTLCELIDSCNSLWEYTEVNKESLKELCAIVIELMVKQMLEKNKIPGKSVSWMYNMLCQRVEWHTRMHLVEFFQSASNAPNNPMLVPGSLRTALKLEEDSGWKFVDDILYSDDILSLLMMAKICDASLKVVLSSLNGSAFRRDRHIYNRLVVALAQILPDSSVSEWIRAMTLVKELFQQGVWSMSSQVLTGPVPLLDFSGVRSELGILHLFRDVLTVLTKSSTSSKFTDNMWAHMSRAVLTCIKTLCLPTFTSETQNRYTCRFALCHAFCLLCHMMCSQPTGCLESLFVLSLEVLSSYDSAASLQEENLTNDGLNELDRERKVMLECALKCPDEEKETLLKKLKQ